MGVIIYREAEQSPAGRRVQAEGRKKQGILLVYSSLPNANDRERVAFIEDLAQSCD